MKHYVYETINIINNKTYIGVHKGLIDDKYLGSGKILQNAINKYGKENFSKRCLFVGRSKEITYWVERTLVDEEFVKDPNTYNIKLGGQGGFDHLTKLHREIASKKAVEKIKWLRQNDADWCIKRDKGCGLGMVSRKQKYPGGYSWKQTDEAVQNQKEVFKKINHQQGSKNSQYGTMWITNGTESKKISKGSEIPEGWYKGRKIK